MALPDPVKLAIPFFVGAVLLEMIVGRVTGRARFAPADTLTSLVMGLGNTLSGGLAAGVLAAVGAWVYGFRLLDIGWTWWAFVLAFIADDFFYYWGHRAGHRIRWFWASHVVHHSSQHYNLTTALRQTWTGAIALGFVFRFPLLLLGFPWEMIAFVAGLNLIYQFWIHTEAIGRLPAWFEAVMNTPSHHRVHHATNPPYLDANYAGVFIVWDKLFKSFVAEDRDEPCRYGIVKNLATFNPLKVAFHEWAGMARDVLAAASWRARLAYLVAPPGWSPDGSRETTDKIKARWRAAQNRG